MADSFTLYVVDEQALPTSLGGTDSEKRDALVARVEAVGDPVRTLHLPLTEFDNAVCEIDDACNGRGFIPVMSFNNSPSNVLGNEPACADFGYFTPEMAKALHKAFGSLDPKTKGELEGDELVAEVFEVYAEAAKKAAGKGHAIAVVHA